MYLRGPPERMPSEVNLQRFPVDDSSSSEEYAVMACNSGQFTLNLTLTLTLALTLSLTLMFALDLTLADPYPDASPGPNQLRSTTCPTSRCSTATLSRRSS